MNNDPGFQYNSSHSGIRENDYVVLKLDYPLDFNNDVQPACLPSSNTYLGLNSTEEQCYTSGWGLIDSEGLFQKFKHNSFS